MLRFIAEIAKNDYTWTKPSNRYLPMGLYLPKLESLEVGKVIFAIDTSGSIDTELLQEFASELKEASKMFSFPVTIIHCDSKVQKVEEMEDDDHQLRPVGRGGTEFQPVFDHVDENIQDAKAIVYFTDGEASLKLKEPFCPVVWAVYDNKKFNPPFGEVIYLHKQ